MGTSGALPLAIPEQQVHWPRVVHGRTEGGQWGGGR